MSNAKAINILYTRNQNGEVTTDAAAAPVVRSEELRASGNALENLTFNVMAGKVGAPIRKAADNKKLAEVLPGDQLKNQRSALAFLLTIPAGDIRDKWAEYCNEQKRVTPPTLQRLHKLCKPPKKSEPRFDYKAKAIEAAEHYAAGNKAMAEQCLHDIAVEAGIIKTDDEPNH